jgi:hypothetical protein
LRLALSGNDETTATARDLAARETQCCSFFDFEVDYVAGSDTVIVDIVVPDAHVAVLDALAERATLLSGATAR